MKRLLESKIVTIYSVSHPITNMIFYVGRTTTPLQKRLGAMLTTKEIYNNNLSDILKSIKEEGRKPVIEELDKCDYDNRMNVEEFWIQTISGWGFDIKNVKHKRNPCHKKYVIKYPKDRSPVVFSNEERDLIALTLNSDDMKEVAINNGLSKEILRIHLSKEVVPKWVRDMLINKAEERSNLIVNKFAEYKSKKYVNTNTNS